MSVGIFLDEAEHALAHAARRLETVPWDGNQATAVLAVRDQIYRDLNTLLTRTGVPSHHTVSMQTALALLDKHDTDVPPSRQIAIAIRAATLDLPQVAPGLLRAPGSAAAPLVKASAALGMANEILATHCGPAQHQASPGSSPKHAGTAKPLTREGAAIRAGAQAPQILGEVCRLAWHAVAIDRQILTAHTAAPHALDRGQWHQLRQWADSGYRNVMARLGAAEPAILLRHLQVAPDIERSTGPRMIGGWRDAVATVHAVRSAVFRDRQQATLGLVASAARLGFAATAAGWKASGLSEPSPDITGRCDRWRRVGEASGSLADLRERPGTPLIAELDQAAGWIRQQITDSTPRLSIGDIGALVELQQQLKALCADLRRSLPSAASEKSLMTRGSRDTEAAPRRAETLAPARWHAAGPGHPALVTLMDALRSAEQMPVTLNLPGALRATAASSFTARPAGPAGTLPSHTGTPEPATSASVTGRKR